MDDKNQIPENSGLTNQSYSTSRNRSQLEKHEFIFQNISTKYDSTRKSFIVVPSYPVTEYILWFIQLLTFIWELK